MAATGLVGEFDRVLGWPRELVVCLDRAWATAQREHALSPFQIVLLELADHIVSHPPVGGIPHSLEARPDLPDQPTTLVLT
jgi:hypothetical protein